MAVKKIETLNKHENPSTNTDSFDVENYLNVNWDKILDVVNNNADELEKKQEKQEGKGLSTNDFTNGLKEKLEGLNNYNDTELKQEIENIRQRNTEQDEEISDLKQEQEIQNTNIEQLQAENAELKKENEELRSIMPSISTGGENITLNGTAEARFKKLGIGGNSKQEVTKLGENILDDTTYSGIEITEGMTSDFGVNSTTLLKLGEALIEGDYSFNIFFTDGTSKGSDGNISMFFYDNSNTNVAVITNNLTLTQEQIENIKKYRVWTNSTGLETYKGKTIKGIMLVKGSVQPTEYKEFIPNSPSPEFPSEIQTVKDSANFTICNKNLIQIDKTKFPFSKNGLDFNLNENGDLVVNGTATEYTDFEACGIFSEKNYFLKLIKDKYYKFNNGTTTDKITVYFTGEKTIQFNNNAVKKVDFDTKLGVLAIQITANTTFENEVFELQLEEVQTSSSSSTEHVEHKEQSLTIPVQQEMLERR